MEPMEHRNETQGTRNTRIVGNPHFKSATWSGCEWKITRSIVSFDKIWTSVSGTRWKRLRITTVNHHRSTQRDRKWSKPKTDIFNFDKAAIVWTTNPAGVWSVNKKGNDLLQSKDVEGKSSGVTEMLDKRFESEKKKLNTKKNEFHTNLTSLDSVQRFRIMWGGEREMMTFVGQK